MSELRLDPLTGRWVVIAGERARRPSAFATRSLPVENDPNRPCPFCPGNEDLEPEIPTLKNCAPGGRWQVRVVGNRYPAFGGHDPMVVNHLGPVFTQAPGSGLHEILILTPDHDQTWADLSEEHAASVMEALRDRMAEYAITPGLRYSQAVVNCGREAGASLNHSHAQLLSTPFVPAEASSELAGFARFQGNCLICATIEAEEQEQIRVLYADRKVAAISPFWSGSPYELMILPRSHHPHLHLADDDDLAAVGRSIQLALAALRDRLGDVAYNIVFHTAPTRLNGDYHWHVHVVPKVTTKGGFELGSGVFINVVPPEVATEELLAFVPAHA